MKKILLLFVSVLLLASLLAGCGGDPAGAGIVEIRERFFVREIHAINMNADEYVGRTVKYEGLFQSFYWAETGEYFFQVYRYVFDCCGTDKAAGFEVYLGDIAPLPDGAWVEVIGVLEWYEVVEGSPFLRVAAISVRELDERGAETVMA